MTSFVIVVLSFFFFDFIFIMILKTKVHMKGIIITRLTIDILNKLF
jgi:hypothetical protein